MNIDTIIGIAVITVILFAVKLIDNPPRGKRKRKDRYLTRIEDEFSHSLNTYADKKIKQMSTHYGLNIELNKLTTKLNFKEVDENER